MEPLELCQGRSVAQLKSLIAPDPVIVRVPPLNVAVTLLAIGEPICQVCAIVGKAIIMTTTTVTANFDIVLIIWYCRVDSLDSPFHVILYKRKGIVYAPSQKFRLNFLTLHNRV